MYMLFQTVHLEILDTLDFDCGSEKNAKFEPSRLSKAKKRSIRFFNASQQLKKYVFLLMDLWYIKQRKTAPVFLCKKSFE